MHLILVKKISVYPSIFEEEEPLKVGPNVQKSKKKKKKKKKRKVKVVILELVHPFKNNSHTPKPFPNFDILKYEKKDTVWAVEQTLNFIPVCKKHS